MRTDLLRAALGLLPILSYPLWGHLFFYRPLLPAVGITIALELILFGERLRERRVLPESNLASAFIVGLSACAIYAAVALGAFGEVKELTGDEPNYVLAAHSLVHDGDIRLKNNFAHRDYQAFYPGTLVTRTTQGRDRGGYPVHGVAVSAYLAPFYYVGGKSGSPHTLELAIRLAMALVASCLAAAVFMLLRVLDVARGRAAGVSLLMAVSPPILNYALLVYPETSVALIIALFFTCLFAKTPSPAACGVLASLCPWFGVKFNAIAAALTLSAIGWVTLRKTAGWRPIARFVAAMAPSWIVYELFLWRFYGSLSPAAAAGGRAATLKDSVAENLLHYFSQNTSEKLRYMLQTFLADLIDQKGGLLLYAPFTLFGLYGIVCALRGSELRLRLASLALPAAVHLGLYSYTNYLGGFCPPGRPTLPLLPLLAPFLAIGMERWRNGFSKTLILIGTWVLSTATLLTGPLFFHSMIYSEERAISNLSVFLGRLTDYLPVLTVPGVYETRNILIVFTILLLALLTAGVRTPRIWSPAFAVSLAFGLALAYSATPHVIQSARSGDLTIEFLDAADAYVEEEGMWLRGSCAGRMRIVSERPIDEISFRVRAEGALRLQVIGGASESARGETVISLPLDSRAGQPPYEALLEYAVEGGFRPSERDPSSHDRRWLGAFLQ